MSKTVKGLRKHTKKGGRGKKETWKKGQSSSSNPQTNVHREAARCGYYADRSDYTRIPLVDRYTRRETNKNSVRPSQIPALFPPPPSSIRQRQQKSSSSSLSIEERRFTRSSSSSSKNSNDDNDYDSVIAAGETRASSIHSHASEWTRCTNPTFEEFMENWTVDSALHREMMSVLASATEIIAEKHATDDKKTYTGSNTEYFALFLTTLSSSTAANDNISSRVACLALASMVADKLPVAIRRAKFSEVTKQIVNIMQHATTGESKTSSEQLTDLQNSPLFLVSGIKVLAAFLRCQDESVWRQPATLHRVFDTLLHLLVHNKPKVRKSASHAIESILREDRKTAAAATSTEHPAVSRTVTFIREKLNDCLVTNNQAGLLQLMELVRNMLPYFSGDAVRPIIDFCLRLIGHGGEQTLLSLVAFKTLQALFGGNKQQQQADDDDDEKDDEIVANDNDNDDNDDELPKKGTKRRKSLPSSPSKISCNVGYETAAQLLNALYDQQPNATNKKATPIISWLRLQASIILHLYSLCAPKAIKHLPRFMRTCALGIWQQQQQVPHPAHNAVGATLVHLFSNVELIIMPPSNNNDDNTEVAGIVKNLGEIMQSCMQFPYHTTWPQTAQACGALFYMLRSAPDDVVLLTAPLLQGLSNMRRQPQCMCIPQIDLSLSHGVKNLGVDFVLQALPLKYDDEKKNNSKNTIEFEGTWILPIIIKSLQSFGDGGRKVHLAQFMREFMPLLHRVEHVLRILKMKTLTTSEDGGSVDRLTRAFSRSLSLNYENLRGCQSMEEQLWTLLALYCRCAVDLEEEFTPQFAQQLASLLTMTPPPSQYQTTTTTQHVRVFSVLRAAIQNTKRHSVNNSSQKEEKYGEANIMTKYAKNYMPILFSIYTNNSLPADKIRLPALETVKLYLRVAPRSLCRSMLQDIFKTKLSSADIVGGGESVGFRESEKFASVLDLIIALVPYAATTTGSSADDDDAAAAATTNASALVGLVIALLSTKNTTPSRFKKACRLMEELFRANCATVRQLKTAILSIDMAGTAAAASAVQKAPWLRCVRFLLLYSNNNSGIKCFDAELATQLLPIVISSHGEKSKRTREAASAVLLTMLQQYVQQADQNNNNVVHLGDGVATTSSELLHEFIEFLLKHFFLYQQTTADISTAAAVVDISCAVLLAISNILCSNFGKTTIWSPLTSQVLVENLCARILQAQNSKLVVQEQRRLAQRQREKDEAKEKKKKLEDDAVKNLPKSFAAPVPQPPTPMKGIRRKNPVNLAAVDAENDADEEMHDVKESEENIVAVVGRDAAAATELAHFYKIIRQALDVFNAAVLKLPFNAEHVMPMISLLYGVSTSTTNLTSLSATTRQQFYKKLNELIARMLRKFDYAVLGEIWPGETRKLLTVTRRFERRQIQHKQRQQEMADTKNRSRLSRGCKEKIGKKQRKHLHMQDRAAELLFNEDEQKQMQQDDRDAAVDNNSDEEEQQNAEDEKIFAEKNEKEQQRGKREKRGGNSKKQRSEREKRGAVVAGKKSRRVATTATKQKLREKPVEQIVDFLDPKTMWRRLY